MATTEDFIKVWGTSGTLPGGVGSWHVTRGGVIVISDADSPNQADAAHAYLRASGCTPPDRVDQACKKYGFVFDEEEGKWRRENNGKRYHIVKDGPTEMYPKIDTPEKVAAFCVLHGIPEQES